jgi:hypothetical protein
LHCQRKLIYQRAMNIPTDEDVLQGIRAFLERHDMKPSRFGREATGEGQLIASIEAGRSPSLATLQRVAAYMEQKDGEMTGPPPRAPAAETSSEACPVGASA